ncbi:hypothetical protein JHK86_052274 [Glycine max]|nr:hypothetical protein JHK86_052274 [Glycine max]
MSSSQRASIVAASVGVVEALKDQRVCRWNHTLKSSQHVIKSHVGSLSQAKNLSFSSSMKQGIHYYSAYVLYEEEENGQAEEHGYNSARGHER